MTWPRTPQLSNIKGSMGEIRAVTPSHCPYLEMLGPEFVLEGFLVASVAGFSNVCATESHGPC